MAIEGILLLSGVVLLFISTVEKTLGEMAEHDRIRESIMARIGTELAAKRKRTGNPL